MNAIAPHQVTSNANSKLVLAKMIVSDTATAAEVRMQLLTDLCNEFRDEVSGSTVDPFRRPVPRSRFLRGVYRRTCTTTVTHQVSTDGDDLREGS